MNIGDHVISGGNSPQSESDYRNEEKSERKVRNIERKLKSSQNTPGLAPSIDATSIREKKKIDQYARLFEQQAQAQQKKLKKIKPNQKQQQSNPTEVQKEGDTKSQKDERPVDDNDRQDDKYYEAPLLQISNKQSEIKHVVLAPPDSEPKPDLQRDSQHKEQINFPRDSSNVKEFSKEPQRVILLDVDRESPMDIVKDDQNNIIQTDKQIMISNPQIVTAQVIQQSLDSKFLAEDDQPQQTFTLNINPKLRLKERHHLFLYLSECQDKCLSGAQKISKTAPQFYSPPRQGHREREQQLNSSLFAINQEVFHETQILTNSLTNRFKSYGDTMMNFGPEQREFVSKFLERKYLKNTLRESRLQICKRGSEKSNTINNINSNNNNNIINNNNNNNNNNLINNNLINNNNIINNNNNPNMMMINKLIPKKY